MNSINDVSHKVAKENFKKHLARLSNYERVLRSLLEEPPFELAVRDKIFIVDELSNIVLVNKLLKILMEFDYKSLPVDQVFRMQLGIDSRKLHRIFTNGVRLNEEERTRVKGFINE